MKKLFFYLIAGLFATSVLMSCHRNDDEGNSTPTTPAAADGFFYSENGASAQTKMDKADVYAAYNTINANSGSGSGMKICEINLSGLAAGTYAINSSNHFSFVVSGSTTWTATGGSVVITSNANGKLSGTFDVQGSGSSVNRYSGTFTNLVIQ